jgi:hypothetical protein
MATRDRPAAALSSGRPEYGPATRAGEDPRYGADRPRLPDSFHRVYSPPEAPKVKTRRSAGVFVAAFAVMAALAAVAFLAFGRGTSKPAAAPPKATHPPAASPAPAKPTAALAPTFATIPSACDVLSTGTVRRYVPTSNPTVDRMGVDTASVCKYSFSQGHRYRAVQVDARAFLPRYMHDEATSMTIWSYEAQWKQAQKDLTADTSSLRRISGLGDAAFERYWIDRDVHVAVGEATVRYRNVVLRMQYTEEQPSAQARAASEQRCLSAAIAAARTGLTAFH